LYRIFFKSSKKKFPACEFLPRRDVYPAPRGLDARRAAYGGAIATHVPSSVTVPAGADFATFNIATAAVASTTSARISASYDRVVRRAAVRIKTQSS
jgi:hypothetical protein